MPYFVLTCDFCGKRANGKSTRTIGLCEDHVNRTNQIPKVAGKKVLNHGGHVSVTPSFGGSTGHKSPIHGSGF